jgi:hypothetical protein
MSSLNPEDYPRLPSPGEVRTMYYVDLDTLKIHETQGPGWSSQFPRAVYDSEGREILSQHFSTRSNAASYLLSAMMRRREKLQAEIKETMEKLVELVTRANNTKTPKNLGPYVLGDRIPESEARRLRMDHIPAFTRKFKARARWTGEYRAPRKGEWYISGSRPVAYRAPNDLETEFFIAQIYLPPNA